MWITDQMGIKVVHVRTRETTTVTPPGVDITVKPLVQEVQSLIGESDVAVLALPVGVGVIAVVVVLFEYFLDCSHWAG